MVYVLCCCCRCITHTLAFLAWKLIENTHLSEKNHLSGKKSLEWKKWAKPYKTIKKLLYSTNLININESDWIFQLNYVCLWRLNKLHHLGIPISSKNNWNFCTVSINPHCVIDNRIRHLLTIEFTHLKCNRDIHQLPMPMRLTDWRWIYTDFFTQIEFTDFAILKKNS